MASDSANIRVFGSGSLWLAPAGTTLPTDINTALNAAFKDCGHLIEDSLSFAGTPEVFRVRAYGVARPVRVGKRLSQESFSAAVQEWKTDNLKAVFGGGSVTVTGVSPNQVAKYVPPADTAITDLAAVFVMADGTKDFRLVIPSCKNLSGFTLTFRDNDSAGMPLSLEVQGGTAGVDPWYILSDDVTALSAG